MPTRTATFHKPTKKATNLTLNRELLDQAKALGLNISEVCEQGLASAIKVEQERRWLAEHQDFLEGMNDILEQDGLPLDEWKTF